MIFFNILSNITFFIFLRHFSANILGFGPEIIHTTLDTLCAINSFSIITPFCKGARMACVFARMYVCVFVFVFVLRFTYVCVSIVFSFTKYFCLFFCSELVFQQVFKRRLALKLFLRAYKDIFRG